VAHVASSGAEAPDAAIDPDSDEALDAYNRMLARLDDD
jgi:hypothetical protein